LRNETQHFQGFVGLFNLVEGLIDHQIFGIHHVKPGLNQLAWDVGILVFGALLILIGWIMIKTEVRIQQSLINDKV